MQTAIYMRVSSERQALDGQSLGFQRSLLLDYINTHPGLVLYDEYIDDGISGTKFEKRDELQRMLNDAVNGKIDLILFTKLDRFFRSVRHLMNTLDILEKHGVKWKAVQENHDNESPTGKLLLTIVGAFGEMEANMDSQRTKDAFAHKISKGEWLNTKVPYGYKIENKKAVPDPEKTETVKRMFKDYLMHGTLIRVINDYSPLGAPITNRGMRHMLSNRAYIGEAHGIKDFMPPIIDRGTFEAVQRMLSMNVKASQKHTYIFSGLMVCPECGHKMSGTAVQGKYNQYHCPLHKAHRCGFSKNVSELKLESYIMGRYKDDLTQRYLTLKAMANTDNSQKVSQIRRKIDRLKDLYVNELIDLDTYKSDLDKYRHELDGLESPKTDSKAIEAILSMNVYDIYHTLTKEQKRRLWRSVITSITPQSDGTFFIEYQ